MNRISFLDELMKLGGVRSIIKEGNQLMSDPPAGMMSGGGVPDAEPHRPDEASSRLPAVAGHGGNIESGKLGNITNAKSPIDQHKFNRAFRSNS